MIKAGLTLRTSRRYASGWDHLDSSRYLGRMKLTAPRVLRPGNGYDIGPVFIQRARVAPGLDREQVKQALVDTLGGSRCRHEHDCCGCATRHVQVRALGNRDYAIRTSMTFNY
jgi:hypothetical protein